MKKIALKIFSPVLSFFEKGAENARIAGWKRPVVLIVSLILIGLAISVPFVAPEEVRAGALLPTIVFGSMGIVGLIVGLLGSDRAVARLLGGR